MQLMSAGVELPPVVNQIEVNPFLYRSKTIDFFKEKGVLVESYRALCDGKKFDHPLIVSLAEKYKRSPGQILGRFCVQSGVSPILKSTKVERMEENADLFSFEIDDDDMQLLKGLTDDDNKARFEELYRKCVNRDTPLDGTMEGVREVVTVD